MKKITYIIAITYLAIGCSCYKDDEGEYKTDVYPLWSKKLNVNKDNALFHNMDYLPTYKNIIVQDNYYGGNHYLEGYNTDNGEKVWSLEYNKDRTTYDRKNTIGKYFICYDYAGDPSGDSVDLINIETGKIERSYYIGKKLFALHVCGDEFIINTTNYDLVKMNINEDGVQTSEGILKENFVKKPYMCSSFYESMNNKYLFLSTLYKKSGDDTCYALYSLYNLTENKWEYQDVAESDKPNASYVSNEKYYTSGGEYPMCINPYTGETIWIGEKVTEGFGGLTGDFIEYKDYLVADFSSGNMVVYNKNTGKKSHIIPANGTSIKLELNGILYWKDYGSGRFRAAEISTGKRIWDIESPDLLKNELAWFKADIGLTQPQNGEKGKIVVRSWLEDNIYCYEAIR